MDEFKHDIAVVHSLGELSALIDAGALPFEDGLTASDKRRLLCLFCSGYLCIKNVSVHFSAMPSERIARPLPKLKHKANGNSEELRITTGERVGGCGLCISITSVQAIWPRSFDEEVLRR